MDDADFMRRAIGLSCESVASGGGPFAAIVVRDGEIVGEGINRVVPNADPTAHAEIVAIRAACRKLGSHVLDDATIYTSCEPCPMCLGAIYWARLDKIYFANDRHDAAAVGFRDDFLYRELPLPPDRRAIPALRLLRAEGQAAFAEWDLKPDKVRY
jgi:tRNA(Arg) A34 adenosine deaminase TadA